jgi:hypothetical protein
MCTYSEETWHQEADSEKEGGKFAELARYRWVVEWTLAWLAKFRRLTIR